MKHFVTSWKKRQSSRMKHFFKNFLRKKTKLGVAGLWEDEASFLEAVYKARQLGEKDFLTLTPYPVHGLEEATETPRSWIPWVTFFFGLGGCLFGLWFTWWTSAVDWPIIIGGKPFWSLPAFIPVIFELTILFAALSSIGALIYACGLPHIDPPVVDPALSSHKFAILIFTNQNKSAAKVKTLLSQLKPSEVKETEF